MLKTKLRKYQRVGVRKIIRFKGRALVADDPGLGKTIQAIAARERLNRKGVTVIICPAIAKYEWQDQLRDHAGVSCTVLSGREPFPLDRWRKKHKVVVINYDILGSPTLKNTATWASEIKRLKPRMVVIDELHMIKDRTTIRYKAVRFLCKGVKYVIGLSGTPAENCPAEFWPGLNIIRPDKFNSFYAFGHEFCGPKRVPWRSGWEFKGATKIPKLNRLLRRTCMVRRRKEDVLKDLPAKQRVVTPVDITRPKEYAAAEKDLIKWLIKRKKKSRAMRAASNERLLRVGYLKRLAAELKLKAVIEWVEEFLKTGKKLLLFGVHRKVLGKVYKRFRKVAVKVDGSVTGRKRRMATEAFNNDNRIRLFVGNIRAAGTAWSCKATSDILIVELPWTPGSLTQAEDRCHGLGRGIKGMKVTVHFLVARGTIEERLVKMIVTKQRALGRILDGKRSVKLEILDLLEQSLTRRAA